MVFPFEKPTLLNIRPNFVKLFPNSAIAITVKSVDLPMEDRNCFQLVNTNFTKIENAKDFGRMESVHMELDVSSVTVNKTGLQSLF